MASPGGQAFFISPKGGQAGPGILVLHSWWGLNDWVREFCRRLADEGYTVLAPDLLEGHTPATAEEGEAVLAESNADEMAGLILASVGVLARASAQPDAPIGVIGFSMGASLAYWLAARAGAAVGAAVGFYGSQAIDFDGAEAAFQGHYGEDDALVSEDDRVTTEAFIRLGNNDTEFHYYPSARHWFFEAGDHFDPDAADLAWSRMMDFLQRYLGQGAPTTP